MEFARQGDPTPAAATSGCGISDCDRFFALMLCMLDHNDPFDFARLSIIPVREKIIAACVYNNLYSKSTFILFVYNDRSYAVGYK
jgi:hypothetical protein